MHRLDRAGMVSQCMQVLGPSSTSRPSVIRVSASTVLRKLGPYELHGVSSEVRLNTTIVIPLYLTIV